MESSLEMLVQATKAYTTWNLAESDKKQWMCPNSFTCKQTEYAKAGEEGTSQSHVLYDTP